MSAKWLVQLGVVFCLSASSSASLGSLLPPLAPVGLHCDPNGASAATLAVSCLADPKITDIISFEVALADDGRGWPFLHYTAAVGPDGSVQASIPGLKPDTLYNVLARSHRRGFAEDSRNGTWSEVVANSGICKTAAAFGNGASAAPGPPVVRRKGRVATQWLEVYRMTEHGYWFPDFLDNHNSGDFGGDFAFVSSCGTDCPFFMNISQRVPVTRYCVEVQSVLLPNVSTVTTTGEPRTSAFADYLSCNRLDGQEAQGSAFDYECLCDNLIDRVFAHHPMQAIEEACPGQDPERQCFCSEQSLATSAKFTGMTPLPLPLFADISRPERNNVTFLPVAGYFYSHPYSGRCPFGAQVGDGGCTWQRSPLSHSIYTVDLLRLGWNVTSIFASSQLVQDIKETLQNFEVARRALAALDLPSCGPDSVGEAPEAAAPATRVLFA